MMTLAMGVCNKPAPPGPGRIVKINFANFSDYAHLPDWNDLSVGEDPLYFLLDSEGETTTWKLQPATGTSFDDLGIYEDSFTAPTSPDPDFVNDVTRTEWYMFPGDTGNLDWKMTGLNDAKNYTIKVFCYDPDENAPTTTVAWGSNSQDCNPGANPTVLYFEDLSPSGGVITGLWGGIEGFVPINAMIIIEN